MECLPSPCEAVVSEGSEPIPNDPYTVHEFRLRVDITCDAGGTLTDMLGCDSGGTTCTFVEAPTLAFQVVCSN